MMELLKINRLQHVGIPVTDIKTSIAFYEKLGFYNAMSSTFTFNDEDGGMVAMMQNGDIILELYQMPETELQKIRARKDGHVDHIAFDVDDVEATFLTLKNAGYTVMEPQPVFLAFWKNGCKYFNILGPDGERLEFNQIL
jgi:catechol 2,3-dioxygenase-like lactoylglutathione lyase family enzyme